MEPDLQLLPEQASSIASRIDALYFFLWAISGFFTLLIFCLVVFLAIRYRRRSEADRPTATVDSFKLELTWTLIPLVIVMVIFFWGARLYFVVYRAPANALTIHVVGKQWMWKLQHPEGPREINTLHVPRDQPVKLVMSSQDVIHSFFIPAFRVKMDVIPGRYTTAWFTPTKVGEYHLFCTEYCGTLHSGMIGKVVVMEPEAYQAWLAGAVVDEPMDLAGARLFKSMGCGTCHGVQAPSLAGVFGSTVRYRQNGGGEEETTVADENYIRESIMDSTAKVVSGFTPIMPSYRGQVSEEQLFQLTEYIKSLSMYATPATQPQAP
jgi:cytochrome c oxidase subunit 2